MGPLTQARPDALVHGQSIKRANGITALLSGALPGLVLSLYLPFSFKHLLLGFAVGLLWANAFEYVYHRYLLHLPKSSLAQGHLTHHRKVGAVDEPEHVTFGESPFWVVLLFALNGLPVIIVGLPLHSRMAGGILMGFAAYFLAVEEIHWRIHLGGWLPPGLSAAREYHMAHHDYADGRFNVFLPIFDLLLGSLSSPVEQSRAVARCPGLRVSRWGWRTVCEMALVYVCVVTMAVLFRLSCLTPSPRS